MAGEWQAPKAAWTSADAVTTADLDRMDRVNPEFLRDNMGRGMGYPRTVAYDAGTDTLTVTFDPVRVRFGGSLVEKAVAFSHPITPVAINTTYYVYLSSSAATSHNTTGVIPTGSIPLCQVAVGALKTTLTLTDLRGTIDATGKIAQDNLDAHTGAADPHPQYATDADLTTHKTAAVLDHPDGSATTAKLADGSVTTAKIADGAVTAAKVAADVATQAELDAHTNRTDNPHAVTAAQIGAANILAQIETVDGAGSGLDADMVDGAHAGNASGSVALANGTVVTNLNADTVDGYHASSLGALDAGAKIITLLAPDIHYQTLYTTPGNASVAAYDSGGAGLASLVPFKFLWEIALATGRSVYFEAYLQLSQSGTTAYAALRNAGGTLYGQISATADGRVRSAALSLPDNTELFVSLWCSAAYIVRLFSARLIIK